MGSGSRSAKHQGRTTSWDDEPARRQRKPVVVITAWVVVGGLVLGTIIPVLMILFG
jgi:hypothetical protein